MNHTLPCTHSPPLLLQYNFIKYTLHHANAVITHSVCQPRLTCPWFHTVLQWSSASRVDSRGELIQSTHHVVWTLLPTRSLTCPDNTILCWIFSVVYLSSSEASTKPARVQLLTLGRWFFFFTPTCTNHPPTPHRSAAQSQGMPLSTSGERQSPTTFCQFLKSFVPNTTTTPVRNRENQSHP